MATRTVARLYDDYEDASRVVSDLEVAGIPHSDISIVSNDKRHHGSGAGAGAGASLGTIIGGGAGLLAGIGALAIPGVGPVIAAGWLVATITGAGIGAAAGGLIGSLTGAGVSEDEANVYGEGVRRGGSLVTVRSDEPEADRALEIMDRHRPVDWQARGTEYRQSGWTRFDPDAPAVDASGPNAAIGSGNVSDLETDRLRPGGRL